ncbi:hypothetical protein E4U54_006647 [Claviceps lovelessii]|nr:hypothetical protein E4U54_006647 [Claviceps lovelessii]
MTTTTDESTPQDTTFKDQLDKAATEQLTEFIPAASKILGTKEQPKQEKPSVPGPPERPVHDPSIATFVRDQHRSKQPGGDLDSVAQE